MKLPFLSTGSAEELLDKYAVQELIQYERYCRDNGLWEEMKRCYTPDSTVRISWYQGSGYGFVEASRAMATHAPHKLYHTLVWLHGDRAAAVAMAAIQTRKTVRGTVCDLTSYVRMLYKVRREPAGWRIVSFACVYEKDTLLPSAPEGLELKRPVDRESYANLAAVLGSAGHTIAPDLPGDDRPDLAAEQVEDLGAYLAGEHGT